MVMARSLPMMMAAMMIGLGFYEKIITSFFFFPLLLLLSKVTYLSVGLSHPMVCAHLAARCTCASSSSSSTTAITSRFRYTSRQNRSCSVLYSAYDESIIPTHCVLHTQDNLFRCSFFYFLNGEKLAVDLLMTV